jgi:hypothetical protein
VAAARAGYRVVDQKFAEGNRRITGAYPAIGEFFRELWGFVSGFVEGTREGWRRYQQSKTPAAVPAEPGVAGPDPDQEPKRVTAEVNKPEPNPAPPAPLTPEPTPEPLAAAAPIPLTPSGQGQPLSTGPAGPGEGILEGDVMTADNMVALPAQGETNLDLILQAFSPIPTLLGSVRQQLPDLHIAQLQIRQLLDRIRDLCHTYGAPAVVWQCLAEAGQVVAALGTGLKIIETDNEAAAELAEEALRGLRPAHEDLQVVHAEAASGEMFAAAGAAA